MADSLGWSLFAKGVDRERKGEMTGEEEREDGENVKVRRQGERRGQMEHSFGYIQTRGLEITVISPLPHTQTHTLL